MSIGHNVLRSIRNTVTPRAIRTIILETKRLPTINKTEKQIDIHSKEMAMTFTLNVIPFLS